MTYKLNKPGGSVVMVQRNNQWQQLKQHPDNNAAAAHLAALVAKASAAISKPKVKAKKKY